MENWLYNEFKHCGVDYSSEEQADGYDALHHTFRDYEKEYAEMIGFLELGDTENMTMIDFGCGTGASALFAAKSFKRVFAVDVSAAMIAQARRKASATEGCGPEFHIGGFLTYRHAAPPVDLVMTKHAFHHLPDFWKQVALFRMNRMMKMHGILYLCDVVFNLDRKDFAAGINDWVKGFEAFSGKELRLEVETHIREEYSTLDWILAGMFERSGFTLVKQRSADGFIAEYQCRKTKETEYEER